MTRREFTIATGAASGAAVFAAGALAQPAPNPLTARQVIERIQKNLGVPWKTPTRDVFKAGNPETVVTGIATTVMSTLAILQRAAKSGKNLVITHEPTFWSDGNGTGEFATDAVYQQKAAVIEKNNLVIWRFHDHWHAKHPDAMLTGFAQDLGWTHPDETGRVYDVAPTTLGAMAKDMQDRLRYRGIRVIGDPAMKITRGAINVGSTSLPVVMKLVPEVDVFVCGEPREWEGPEYVQDAVAAGQKKAMIIVGHQNSEDPGMRLCAEWLKTLVAEVPVEWIPTSDPFSRGDN